jgi:hypothetical protein
VSFGSLPLLQRQVPHSGQQGTILSQTMYNWTNNRRESLWNQALTWNIMNSEKRLTRHASWAEPQHHQDNFLFMVSQSFLLF